MTGWAEQEYPGTGTNPGPPRKFSMANSIKPAVVRFSDGVPDAGIGTGASESALVQCA